MRDFASCTGCTIPILSMAIWIPRFHESQVWPRRSGLGWAFGWRKILEHPMPSTKFATIFRYFFADNFQHIHFWFVSTSMVRSILQAFCVFFSSKLQIQVSHLCHCRVMPCRHQSRALVAKRKGNCFVPQTCFRNSFWWQHEYLVLYVY